MADVAGLQLAVCKVPYLDHFVPAQERMMGLLLLGKKLTQDTHSDRFSFWKVYLHTPEIVHSLMVLSQEPEEICQLSEKATLSTSLVWCMVVPIVRSQR